MSSSSGIAAGLVDRGPGGRASSVYVHIPFCRDRCSYCAFVTLADDASLHEPLVAAILAEAGRHEATPLQTLYLGGGTPALLEPATLGTLLAGLQRRFPLAPRAEVTLEANPSNVTRERLDAWAQLGISRVSVGVQTFRDDVLARLGRRHDAAASLTALRLLREHWRGSWSADLLMGWRDQHASDARSDVESLLAHEPPHVSVYGLTVEPGTPLAAQAARGINVTVSRASQPRLDDAWSTLLEERGYERYEISNFARAGHRSRHNQAYWANRSYLGLGPGAASSVHPLRWTNRADLAGYIAAAARGGVRASAERIAPFPRLLETLAIGLRVREGLALADLDARFSPAWRRLLEIDDAWALRSGLLTLHAGRLALNAGDRVRVDAVTAELARRAAADAAAGRAGPASSASDAPGGTTRGRGSARVAAAASP